MPKEKKFTTISIPTVLFNRAKEKIRNTSFPSVSSYVAYILREMLVGKKKGEGLRKEDENKIKMKLRDLGYL
jgi:Arc/MetJ-type ribon-helix-helix transcriptional regulator